jgi:hypothetical protein
MTERVRQHVLSQLVCLGRHTLTGVLGASGGLFADWSADYRMYSRKRVDPAKLFTPVRRTLTDQLAPDAPLISALDDTRLKKTGRKTHGVKYTRDPLGPPFHVNFIKAQRFVQISMASSCDNGMARMIPIDLVHAPAVQKPRGDADPQALAQYRQAQREAALPQVAANRLAILRSAMDEDGQQNRMLWSVVDGGYTNRTFLKNLPGRTRAIGRIRADAKLYERPESSVGKTGRNRVYGPRAPTPEALRQDPTIPWQPIEAFAAGKTHTFKIKTLGPVRWPPAGGQDLRLIVIAPLSYRLCKQGKLLYRKPAYLICTDLDAALEQILQAYLWRWDIEVNFRDEKTLLGVGQAQVRDEQSVERVPALAVAAYAMLLTSATLNFGPDGKPTNGLPAPKWQPKQRLRASTQSLINLLRHELWAQSIRFHSFVSPSSHDTKPQKPETALECALFYAVA